MSGSKGFTSPKKKRMHQLFTESVFITSVIETYTNNATYNQSLAMLPSSSIKEIYNPTWKIFVVFEGRKITPTICSEFMNTLYGTVNTSKLFNNKISAFLVYKY